ncbi:hypothetical protein [Pseudomonas quasicaspiana]|uniref:hypothetical protein n=1 Tax=Pseudomonas quasicaspiana TaxID=2829821 RepID=UPI001E381F7C|nr:hypothetical protein [Pseudomonas quasicaspiana]MCD5969938.1 hypothetical protein [Pseudomonas quasicaspiana]
MIDIPVVKIQEAQSILNSLCEKVKLHRALTLPTSELRVRIPSEAAIWEADYACLLLWPLESSDLDTIKISFDCAQEYFDEILVMREERGFNCDGYLVLALPSAPDNVADELIRDIELSTSVCRKNAIWPNTDPATSVSAPWQRIGDVTVLGLPGTSTPSVDHFYWPDIEDDVKLLWKEIVESENSNASVRGQNS